MANAFSFKEVTTKTMKITGMVDTDAMTVDVDGETKKLSTLLSVFNGCDVDIQVKIIILQIFTKLKIHTTKCGVYDYSSYSSSSS